MKCWVGFLCSTTTKRNERIGGTNRLQYKEVGENGDELIDNFT